MFARTALMLVLLVVAASPATPHSGGTNADGCHTNRSTGDYHCHRPKAPVPGAETYCHIVQGERRCGYSRSACQELAARFGGYCRQE